MSPAKKKTARTRQSKAKGRASTEAPGPGPTPAEGPDRILAFADTLEDQTPAPNPVPVAWETWVTFAMADEVFALPVSAVEEILRVPTVTRVPHAPDPVRGIINMRGRVLPVVDFRRQLALPTKPIDRLSRILVTEAHRRRLGLLVDDVRQVVRIDPASRRPPPADVMTAQSEYLTGVCDVDDELVILLDLDRALVIPDVAASYTTTGDPSPPTTP